MVKQNISKIIDKVRKNFIKYGECGAIQFTEDRKYYRVVHNEKHYNLPFKLRLVIRTPFTWDLYRL